ncbi:uncharacterized protein B0H64DRAFT_227818 [Chaetomium fimeti]|uniref:Uncharacterized protein n=1 Tax=Chaetomium fimeti TaxID=1854472 RepID=A0AAE0H9J8_9PEZI|nr:hypothetical protein B0H64DRAFT_227818 [Chaetomium fimeti]
MLSVEAPFPDYHRKRLREEDEEASAGNPVGFTEHRSKRLQSLPLRTSPNSRRWNDRPNFPQPTPTFAMASQAQVTTPQEPIQEQTWADEPELVSAQQSCVVASTMDNDMDMMDTSEAAPSEQGSIQADPSGPSVMGRIPTPIHCSFAAQVRGNNWKGGNSAHGDMLATTPEEPNAAAFGNNGLVGMSHQKFPAATAAPAMADWGMIQNRRLPSPISECGAEDSQAGNRMALDSMSQHGGHLSHLTHEHPLVAGLPPRASSAMEARAVREGTPAAESQNGNAMDVEPSTTPSPKKGHTRSKHTVNSWTALQPGMTRSFSIGYRTDCERCRNKVPGHFNHIIIS